MIRFRFTEDERRYNLLRAEAYRLIAEGLPPAIVSKVMRNFAKVEQLLYFEGIRQGFAGAELSVCLDQSGYRQLKAFQAHAHIYGSTDTPLRSVELERLKAVGLPEDQAAGAWLDDAPMRYAPQTLSEWENETSSDADDDDVEDMVSFFDRIESMKAADPSSVPYVEGDRPFPAWAKGDPPFPPRPPIHARAKEDLDANDLVTSDNADLPTSSPQILDRVRDYIKSSGQKFSDWTDMIYKIHVGLSIDAGYLDILLSSSEGMTVLSQCGQTHLHPGAAMKMADLPSGRPPDPPKPPPGRKVG